MQPCPARQPGQEIPATGVRAAHLPGGLAGLLAGQRPDRRVHRLPVAEQAEPVARRHLHLVGLLQPPDQARPAPGAEVGTAVVDRSLHPRGHRGALRPRRGQEEVPALRQGREVTTASGLLPVLAIGCR